MCRLIADIDVFNSSAAKVTLPNRATASKAMSGLIEGTRRAVFIAELITVAAPKAIVLCPVVLQVRVDIILALPRKISAKIQGEIDEQDCDFVVHAAHHFDCFRVDDADAGRYGLFPRAVRRSMVQRPIDAQRTCPDDQGCAGQAGLFEGHAAFSGPGCQ